MTTTTISLRPIMATVTAVRLTTGHQASAAAAASTHGTDFAAIILVMVVVLLVAALSSAVQSITVMMTEMLRAARVVISSLFGIVIAIALAIAFLAHH
jgi:hypothetical protein